MTDILYRNICELTVIVQNKYTYRLNGSCSGISALVLSLSACAITA